MSSLASCLSTCVQDAAIAIVIWTEVLSSIYDDTVVVAGALAHAIAPVIFLGHKCIFLLIRIFSERGKGKYNGSG
ncbi:hypothetical protein NKJ84_04210 [Mesorhizobium sp. M0048]|uniref:hypothetical protein n=1 Tax=Mesorhizobium sp. M0048 TaxID=2956860 RepID=UPI00333ACDFB